MATINPAGLIGLKGKKGAVSVGNDADLLLLSPDRRLRKVFVDGVAHLLPIN